MGSPGRVGSLLMWVGTAKTFTVVTETSAHPSTDTKVDKMDDSYRFKALGNCGTSVRFRFLVFSCQNP